MSVTIETIAKWQPPSVLHLLPFSKNNAGTAVPTNSATTANNLVTSQHNPQASYARDAATNNIKGKGLPDLGTTTGAVRMKPRSKSAAVIMDDRDRVTLHKQEQQHRLFRASSERISRSPKKPSGGRGFIERARSEYSTKSDRKLTQEVVTFAIKDINPQILGQSGQNEGSDSTDFDKNPASMNGRYKMKPLLKPVPRFHEGSRWPHNNARFWRSSTISPGERELQRHKTSFDAQLSAVKRSKMVKLNVKDLPRSQTPIGENDPDKLNMKQVIAFLQSSGDVRDASNDVSNEKKRITSSNSVDKNKSQIYKGGEKVISDNNNKDSSAALLIAAKSRRKDETSENHSGGIDKTETTHRNQPNKPDASSKDSNHKTTTDSSSNNLNPIIVKPRPNSYNGEISSKLPAEDGKHSHSQTDNNNDNNNQRNPRPKSLQFLRENTEFRIPARIRQIRESTVDNRPFRLHRFLTLVSNGTDDEVLSTRKGNSRLNTNNHRFISSSVYSNNDNNRSSNNLSRSKDDEKQQGNTYTDSNGFFLTQNKSLRNEYNKKEEEERMKRRRRRRSKTTPSPNEYKTDTVDTGDNNGNEKIICLPTAPVDIDSDDDLNFISLPTVPSKATRKDLVLSAHGHAILTKHFPQVETFKKASIRPHSEKITLKRRLQINGELKERPSTVKPSDLVEWAGVENPERIFLTDTNDLDPKSSTDNLNNPKNKSSDNETPNEGLSISSNLSRDVNSVHSPTRSENNSSCREKTVSQTKSKISDEAMASLTSENRSTDALSDNSKEAVVGCKNVTKTKSNGAKSSKPESVSPSSSDPVRLTLRKERNLTREKSYMVDMKATGNDVYFGQRKYAFKDKVI